MEYSKYIRKWQDASIKLNEAIQKRQFDVADNLMKEAQDAYERFKECSSYPDRNSKLTFGELNHMLESKLVGMFKNDKKSLKECTNLIKNDRNLLTEFKFIDSLRRYSSEADPHTYVNECISLAKGGLNADTLDESNGQFAALLSKLEIGNMEIDEETSNLYKACHVVLSEDRKLNNIDRYNKSVDTICEYVSNQTKKEEPNVQVDFKKMTEELGRKIANLSEEEQSMVGDILDFKSTIAEDRKRNVFENFKTSCLKQIDKMISENKDANELDGLKSIKEQINSMQYCRESVVKDLAKLLEIKEILSEK